MDNKEFEKIVEALSAHAAAHPDRYKLKLGAFASLAYIYISFVLISLVAVIAVLGYFVTEISGLFAMVAKITLAISALIFIVLRSMWVKLEGPNGILILPSDYPDLFKFIDDVRRSIKAPAIDQVIITEELNASIAQIPRLGIFGWQKNYLVLGLPLLQQMSENEIKAVLAHEFGHLSGAHGRFGAWIYRVRLGWARLNEKLREEEHGGSFLFLPFFDWFAPRFAAYSFVMARQQEYEADQHSAQLVEPINLAHALVRLDLKSYELNNIYWPKILSQADSSPVPISEPYKRLGSSQHRVLPNEASDWLRDSLARKSDTADTHPCLKDRLVALGIEPSLPPVLGESAADKLLGSKQFELAEKFDEHWRSAVEDWWKERHEYAQESKEKLSKYHDTSASGLSDEEYWEYAQLTEEFEDQDAAMNMYRHLIEKHENHAGAEFSMGRILLTQENTNGIQHIERAMDLDANAIQPGCEMIVNFLFRNGRDSEIDTWTDRFWEQQKVIEKIQSERTSLSNIDSFESHDLSEEEVDKVVGALKTIGKVNTVYLVRKKLHHSTDQPLFVLGIYFRRSLRDLWDESDLESKAKKIVEITELPGEFLVVPLHGDYKGFEERLGEASNAMIYP